MKKVISMYWLWYTHQVQATVLNMDQQNTSLVCSLATCAEKFVCISIPLSMTGLQYFATRLFISITKNNYLNKLIYFTCQLHTLYKTIK